MEPPTEAPLLEEYYQQKAYYYPPREEQKNLGDGYRPTTPNIPRASRNGNGMMAIAVNQAELERRRSTGGGSRKMPTPASVPAPLLTPAPSTPSQQTTPDIDFSTVGQMTAISRPSALSDQRKQHVRNLSVVTGTSTTSAANGGGVPSSPSSRTPLASPLIPSHSRSPSFNVAPTTIGTTVSYPIAEPVANDFSTMGNGCPPSPPLTAIDPINVIPRTPTNNIPAAGSSSTTTSNSNNANHNSATTGNSNATSHHHHRSAAGSTTATNNTVVSPSATVQKRRSIGDWDFVKTIGAGSMGQVKLAKNRHSGELCAVKVIPKAGLDRKHHESKPQKESDESRNIRIVREAAIGKLLHHKYICQLYEVHSMTNHYYMLFEYVSGGQMLDYIISHGSLKEKQARKFARSIASALDYCHHNSIVHRDLKIENILISKSGDIKIIDFGLSNIFSRSSLLKTFCGSLYFAAPELLNAHPYVGPEVDVWSFGIVLYVLVSGKVPFDDQSMPALHAKIKRGRVEYPTWLSSDCKDLLSRMLVVDPHERAPLSEVMHHPWMIKGYDGPPDSYLPARKPLTLPLDPAVVEGMTGFEFGTPDEIAHKLTWIIESPVYVAAANNWYRIHGGGTGSGSGGRDSSVERKASKHFSLDFYRRRLSGSQFLTGNNAAGGGGDSTGTLGSSGSGGSVFGGSGGNIGGIGNITPARTNSGGELSDPTNAFHPLISIYYLVQEKMERDRQRDHQLVAGSSLRVDTLSNRTADYDLEPVTSPFENDPQRPTKAATRMTRSKTQGANEFEIGRRERGHQVTASTGVTAVSGFGHPSPQPAPVPPQQQQQEQQHQVQLQFQQPPTQEQVQPQPRAQYKSRHQPHLSEPPVVPRSNIAASLLRKFSTKRKPTPLPIGSAPGASPPVISSPFDSPQDDSLNRSASVREGNYQRQSRRAVSTAVPDNRIPLPASYQLPNDFRYPENINSDNMNNNYNNNPTAAAGSTSIGGIANTSANATPTRTRFQQSENDSSLNEKMDFLSVSSTAERHHPSARAKSWGHVRSPRNSNGMNGKDSLIPPSSPIPSADIADEFFDDGLDMAGPGSDNSSTQRLGGPGGPTMEVNDTSMPSIQFPKQVFLKGFFSVQSTSTKSLPFIRSDIIRVLTHLGISFKEVKGGFLCLHKASLKHDEEATFSPPTSPMTTGGGSGGGGSSSGHWRKLSFGSGILSSGNRRRSVLVNGHGDNSSNNMVDSDLSSDSMEPPTHGGVGGSDMLGYSTSSTNPVHTPVRFEIYIVKVPLFSLHGVQFKKLTGNSWQYKSLATKILSELRL